MTKWSLSELATLNLVKDTKMGRKEKKKKTEHEAGIYCKRRWKGLSVNQEIPVSWSDCNTRLNMPKMFFFSLSLSVKSHQEQLHVGEQMVWRLYVAPSLPPYGSRGQLTVVLPLKL